MKAKKTYAVNGDIHCRNCGVVIKLEIPFGMPLKEFTHSRKCDSCGCRIDVIDSLLRNRGCNK